jgi:hypothetical protein
MIGQTLQDNATSEKLSEDDMAALLEGLGKINDDSNQPDWEEVDYSRFSEYLKELLKKKLKDPGAY